MKNLKVMDGNEACAMGAYLFSEVCGIYPITPSSPMATLTDKWSEEGRLNLFNSKVRVVEMQSEAGASALMHGSLQAGVLTTTFTASQGLLLMIPEMYKIAGELLPCVIHVASRSLATHALSIFGDHQDIYAVRSTGFAILASSNVQDAYYMSIISHLSTIKGRVPFLHFFDGFRTSHEINKINILEDSIVGSLLDKKSLEMIRRNALNVGKSITRGTSETEEVYFQNTEVRNKYYLELPDIVNSYMEKINEITESEYKPFTYYGDKRATNIIVAMGSVTDTIKLVVDDLNQNGEHVGVISVYLYRPFSEKYFLNVLPKSVEKITVLDRTKEAGSVAEPLYLDVCNILKEEDILVVGGRYGLSSKDTTPECIKAVFDNMNKHKVKDHFTLGIIDDVTNTNLEIKKYSLDSKWKEIKVWGFGSDGMVSASKNILKVIGKKDGNYVQGYFQYDSKKSGGVTISNLRIGNEPINAPYYVEEANLIVVSKDAYLRKYDILDGIKNKGILLINSSKSDEELNEFMLSKLKSIIKDKHIKVFVSNANKLSEKYNLKEKINNIMAIYILDMLGVSGEDIVNFKDGIRNSYASKGEKIVNNNINAVDEAIDYLREFDKSVLTIEEIEKKNKHNIIDVLVERHGDTLKVSDFLTHEDGTYQGGSSSSDKRKVSDKVPNWIKENCISCNKCAFICPHAVIRPVSLTQSEIDSSPIEKSDTIKDNFKEDNGFYLSINTSNCTGCGLCTKVCPGKNGEKALVMGEYDDKIDKICDYFNQNKEEEKIDNVTLRNLGFVKPSFEFPGACAGCGETVYLRVLTSLFKDNIVIANATGCSSIYGASLPCTPYKVPWINSLFEDNAEFGLGLHTAYKTMREKIKDIMYKNKDLVEPEVKKIFKKYIDNINDKEITNEVKKELEVRDIPKELRSLLSYIPSTSVWIVGGDGWAYDIGYGGLDHVLRSNERVRVLVLDTEVYSNTGGQTSKSTRIGAVAEFSSKGKLKPKKDLFNIAMNIPNVYVASVSAGANENQTIKAFMEAEAHDGPSVIIAYSPCIEHGIMGGLQNSIDEQKLLVESGYNILMRYNPNEDKLTIDSKEPNFSLYESVFEREMRYKNLEVVNNEEYEKLYEEHMQNAKNRYEYYLEYSKREKKEKMEL